MRQKEAGMERTIQQQVAELLAEGFAAAQAAGDLPPFEVPDPVPVQRSRHKAHGDYASPVCMGLAKVLRRAPIQIARAVVPHIPAADFIGKVEVAPPGYINFTLDDGWVARQVPVVLEAGEQWGAVDRGHGERVQVEFVSANPTGPITIGSARNAVIGDTLAAILEAAGYAVEREYYVNDAGSQVRIFGESVLARYAEALGVEGVPFPEKGYRGDYVVELGKQLAAEVGDRYLTMDRKEAVRAVARWAVEQMLESIRVDLAAIRVTFDSWFHERWLYERGLFDEVLARLREKGYVVEHDGAVWFRSPDLEKDAVLIRSPQVIPEPSERPTYLASDVAYLWDKLVVRGFRRAIYVWGADHHGDVPRVKAAAKALGLDPDRLVFILYQLVTLLRGGEEVRMSKRRGDFVTLRELVDEVGPDPIRFMMLTRTVDVKLDFDLDLAVEQSDRNPVYYVQYAHTRIAGVLRHAQAQGWPLDTAGDAARLTHPSELALIRKMLELPEVIVLAADNYAPHHLTAYAMDLAALFHAFYRDCRIVNPDEPELTAARLMLARAAKVVLARVLHLMGMDAPERM